jgi:hypothetical protein
MSTRQRDSAKKVAHDAITINGRVATDRALAQVLQAINSHTATGRASNGYPSTQAFIRHETN